MADKLNETGGGRKRTLLPKHLQELRASGLDDETLRANGVYSESDPLALAKLLNWTGAAGALGSALVFPHFDFSGQPLGHATVKPDRPRPRRDKAGYIKYENPRGRPNCLYIPADARAAVGDPNTPLFITEGCKKALAGTRHGFPCVSLPGVDCWSAPRAEVNGRKVGPRALNAGLASISWDGRPVCIVFDSDAASNPSVRRAEIALANALRGHGANVRIVRLPAEPNGAKNGLDDFLVRHGSEQFNRLVAATIPASPLLAGGEPQLTESGYGVIDGSTFRFSCQQGPQGVPVEKRVKLANFVARIVRETVTDDGAEQTRAFVVAVEQAKTVRKIQVPVGQFSSLDWVVGQLGARFIIQPGPGIKDQLRAAIQELSGDSITAATEFSHTGWRKFGDRWCYLHGAGAVAPIAPVVPVPEQVKVRLDGAASAFRLPPQPCGEELRVAVLASLGVLDGLAPDSVTFPLLATVYRAAMGSADYALWLSGPTGAQKSELAALAQQHYGAGMIRSRLPGSWSSTDNALEALAFTVKDALLVIDDFAPAGSRADADRQHRVAERLIRGQGNGAGRQRLRADATLRPQKPPRGLILATGEDVPRGHSITARLCVVQVRRGDVKLARLSECQRDAASGLYASAMAGFTAWLAPRYAEIIAGLDAERAELRDRFVGRYPHARTPDIAANLTLGLRYLLRFAEANGAISAERHLELWQRGHRALLAAVEGQGDHQQAVDPVARFPEMIATILASGRGHIAGADGGKPNGAVRAEAWGWEQFGSGQAVAHRSRGHKIGWVIGTELYLDPDATFAELSELAGDQGQTYPVSQNTLGRRLKDSGVLRTESDRTKAAVTLEQVRRRVWALPVSAIFSELGQPGQPGHANPETSRTGSVAGAGSIPPDSPQSDADDDVEVFER